MYKINMVRYPLVLSGSSTRKPLYFIPCPADKVAKQQACWDIVWVMKRLIKLVNAVWYLVFLLCPCNTGLLAQIFWSCFSAVRLRTWPYLGQSTDPYKTLLNRIECRIQEEGGKNHTHTHLLRCSEAGDTKYKKLQSASTFKWEKRKQPTFVKHWFHWDVLNEKFLLIPFLGSKPPLQVPNIFKSLLRKKLNTEPKLFGVRKPYKAFPANWSRAVLSCACYCTQL